MLGLRHAASPAGPWGPHSLCPPAAGRIRERNGASESGADTSPGRQQASLEGNAALRFFLRFFSHFAARKGSVSRTKNQKTTTTKRPRQRTLLYRADLALEDHPPNQRPLRHRRKHCSHQPPSSNSSEQLTSRKILDRLNANKRLDLPLRL